jgi:hypothetical protein
MTNNNITVFRNELTRQYEALFANDPNYAYAAARTTPAALADKMTAGLATGGANKDGDGIKRTCKTLGIKHTYRAIAAFLNATEATS